MRNIKEEISIQDRSGPGVNSDRFPVLVETGLLLAEDKARGKEEGMFRKAGV